MRRVVSTSLFLSIVCGLLALLPSAGAWAIDADLVVAETVSPSSAAPGGYVEYRIELTNTTGSPLTVDTVTGNLPSGFAYDGGSTFGIVSSDPAVAAGSLTWTVNAQIAAGDTDYLWYLRHRLRRLGRLHHLRLRDLGRTHSPGVRTHG